MEMPNTTYTHNTQFIHFGKNDSFYFNLKPIVNLRGFFSHGPFFGGCNTSLKRIFACSLGGLQNTALLHTSSKSAKITFLSKRNGKLSSYVIRNHQLSYWLQMFT